MAGFDCQPCTAENTQYRCVSNGGPGAAGRGANSPGEVCTPQKKRSLPPAEYPGDTEPDGNYPPRHLQGVHWSGSGCRQNLQDASGGQPTAGTGHRCGDWPLGDPWTEGNLGADRSASLHTAGQNPVSIRPTGGNGYGCHPSPSSRGGAGG
ncbi:hypothetical protein D3C75_957480 [compost metagenome]